MEILRPRIQVLHHDNFNGEVIAWLLKSDLDKLYCVEVICRFNEIKDSYNSIIVIANPDWISNRIPDASFKNLLDKGKSSFIVLSSESRFDFLNSEKSKVIRFKTDIKEVVSAVKEINSILIA